jgi:putative aldouronate transport system substrate-binding protein
MKLTSTVSLRRFRWIGALLALAAVFPSLGFAAGGKDQAVPAGGGKVSMYMGNSWYVSMIDPTLSDPVIQELMKKTGVSFDISYVKGNDQDAELNLLIASGNLPDIIVRSASSASARQLVAGNLVQELDPLIEKYGPNFKLPRMSWAVDQWREEDGKLFSLGACVFKDPRFALVMLVNTIYLRYDMLKDLAYAKLERKPGALDSFVTWEQYANLLKQVKTRYPDVAPVILQTANAFRTYMIGKGGQLQADWIWEDGKARMLFDSKYALEAIKYFNRLYLDGSLPKDFAVLQREQIQNLVASGKVFSTYGLVSGMNEAQSALGQGNEERRMVQFFGVQDASVKYPMYHGYVLLNSANIHVNAKAKNAEVIMKFLNYTASDEGSFILGTGVEGKTFTKDAKGNPVPTEEVAKGYRDWDVNIIKKTGIGQWFNFWPGYMDIGPHGRANEINAENMFVLGADRWTMYNNADLANIGYSNLVSPAGSFSKVRDAEALDINSKIGAYAWDSMTKAIAASSPDACEAEWKQAVQRMKSDGLDKLNQAADAKWRTLAKIMKRDPDKLNLTEAARSALK